MSIAKTLVTVLVLAPCAAARAAVTIELVGASTPITEKAQESKLYILAKSGTVSNFRCSITSFVPERRDPVSPALLTCKYPEQIEAGKIAELILSIPASAQLKGGNYTASVQMLGLDQTSASVSLSTTLKVSLPGVTMKLADTDAPRIHITRRVPLWPASEVVPIGFQITSDFTPTIVPTVLRSELYVPDGALKDVVAGGSLEAQFCSAGEHKSFSLSDLEFWNREGSKHSEGCADGGTVSAAGSPNNLASLELEITPIVPSNVKEATGTLHIRSQEFQSPLDVPVTVLVKDWWVYAALVVFAGQFLSFSVNNWINVGRRRKLNKLALYPVETGLINLLLKRPDLIDNPEVAVINSFLDNAIQSNKLGDVDAAMTSIKGAQDKLAALAATAVPPPLQQTPAPRLYLLQAGHAYAFRRLNFAIVYPDSAWPPDAVYKWEWKGQKTDWKTLFEAQDLKDIVTEFYAPGIYNIRVSINGTAVATFQVRLDKDRNTGLQWEIAQADKAVLILAVVFAALLSYIAISQLQTFGTVSDYVLAFLAGFGLSSTTSGFSAVLSRFGANPQTQAPAKP
jgi:hypothetical protein